MFGTTPSEDRSAKAAGSQRPRYSPRRGPRAKILAPAAAGRPPAPEAHSLAELLLPQEAAEVVLGAFRRGQARPLRLYKSLFSLIQTPLSHALSQEQQIIRLKDRLENFIVDQTMLHASSFRTGMVENVAQLCGHC